MPRKVMGPILGTLVESSTEKGSRAVGEVGVVEVYESERMAPGRRFVVFSYAPGVDVRRARGFATERFLKTSPCDYEVDGEALRLTNARGGTYVFKSLEGPLGERPASSIGES